MKTFKTTVLLMVPFLLLGCTPNQNSSSHTSKSSNTSSQNSQSSKSASNNSKSDSKGGTTSTAHEHKWSTTWTYDENNHWKTCTDKNCKEINNKGPHEFGEWENVSASTLNGADKYAYAEPKIKKCKTCGYYQLDGKNLLPELRFTSDVASEISFATTATKDDLTRPEVNGKFTLNNCDEKLQIKDQKGTMKVRGNQTAGWQKKGFRLKFEDKVNVLGLNNGKKFKKWVLFADAKDITLCRTALGLYMSKAICKDEEQVWVSDFTPVNVYLNDEYWGYYYLAEQKEVKKGRINLAEPEKDYAGTDIGYCFELDYYAKDEAKKPDGDPTFTVSYKPKEISYNIENSLANFGVTKTYTMLSDITNKDTQLPFIKTKVQNLYTVLYEAAVNKKAKNISGDNVIDSSESIQKVITDNFDLDSWVDGFIINAVCCPPDVGYSSFYMAFDNTETGAKKLRFDNPWDFDSNFGNRRDFITSADTKSGNFDPYYMDRTSNMWLQLLSKLDFFINMVKTKWNKIRDEKVFEGMFHMVREIWKNYDLEFQRNFYKWPENDAAVHNTFDELRSTYKDPANYKKAEEETINWCSKRVNYLEKRWGTGRPNVNTNE